MPPGRRWKVVFAIFISIIGLLFAAAGPLPADDGAIEAEGGAFRLMDEHTSVEMVSERVVADLSPGGAEVDCTFVFKNTVDATTVKMGFPEEGWNSGGLLEDTDGFTQFTTWVDGEEVPTTIEKAPPRVGGAMLRWRAKTVQFDAGQERTVRVRYGGPLGGDSSGFAFFPYTLYTGASWKGPIGQVEVIINHSDLPEYWEVRAHPEGYIEKDNSIAWRWENLEPEPGISTGRLFVSFFPGYSKFYMKGERLPQFALRHPYPTLQDSEVWASLRTLAGWAESQVEWQSESCTALLTMGGHTLALRPKDSEVVLDGETRELEHAPYIKANRLVVPLLEIVPLIGGTATFDAKTKETHLTLPDSNF